MDIMLSAQVREPKEKIPVDFIPAVLYGRGVASVSLKLKRSEIVKVLQTAGESNLITLKMDSGTVKVIVKEVQRSGMTGALLHMDLFQVNMADKITTEIPFHFIGESKAVREKAGSLIKDMDSLEVECLPNDLIDHIDVDISSLNEYHDEISIKDIVLPRGMELTSDVNRIIVSVLPPRVQEEEVEPEAATAAPVVTETEDAKTDKK